MNPTAPVRSASQIRQDFIDFFAQRHAHEHVPGSPVVPHDDPTLLFTNAGMNQFKPLFLGTADRGSAFGRLRRAVNSQPCIRAGGKHNDLDDVGHDTYHHTCFEMLGNWSFGDYFKAEAIAWAWELITGVWKIDPTRVHATYFGGLTKSGAGATGPATPAAGESWELPPDDEARELWLRHLPADHIHPGSMKDNFWEMGETGPCGPCSELHIDLTPDRSGGPLVNAGDERVIEFWNLVFIQFNRGADGKLTPLPAKHVDTGMGFERITRIVQGKNSNYDTDVFAPIFAAIQRVSGAPAYGGRMESDAAEPSRDDSDPTRDPSDRSRHRSEPSRDREGAGTGTNPATSATGPAHSALMRDVAYRVIADHIRTLTFAIRDGALPDKEGRGYVLRRILRRAVRYGWQYLNLHKVFLCELVPAVVDAMGDAFPKLRENPTRIVEAIREEETAFARTLERGIALFEDAATRARHDAFERADASRPSRDREGAVSSGRGSAGGVISGLDAFKLHDTYGFPIDLTQIMAAERGMTVDVAEYERLMEEARERARGRDRAVASVLASPAIYSVEEANSTIFRGFDATDLDQGAYVLHILKGDSLEISSVELSEGERGVICLSETSFYAEQGGQVGDRGRIVAPNNSWEFEVSDTQSYRGRFLHVGRLVRGRVRVTEFGFRVGPWSPGSPLPVPEATQWSPACTRVDRARRESIMSNHTATHLLNWALRETLDPSGEHLQQKGSLVDPEKTRFDFSHGKALDASELERIESLVAEHIRRDLPVETNGNEPAPLADAMKINGLRAVFGEKYPDEVRVVSIGVPVSELLKNPDNPEWRKYSIEFCGGTHVKKTSEIGAFAITHEEGVAKGIRRVVGVTGEAATDAKKHGALVISEAERLLKRSAAGKPSSGGGELETELADIQRAAADRPMRAVDRARLRELLAELQQVAKKQQKQTSAAAADEVRTRVDGLLASATKVGGATLIVADMGEMPGDHLKLAADMIKQRSGSAAILFGAMVAATDKSPAKAMLLAAVSDDLIQKGVKAGDWIKAVAPIVDGGGGGPPTMAQAGGKNPSALPQAMDAGQAWVEERLSK